MRLCFCERPEKDDPKKTKRAKRSRALPHHQMFQFNVSADCFNQTLQSTVSLLINPTANPYAHICEDVKFHKTKDSRIEHPESFPAGNLTPS
jgi:hypothetical protein